MDRYRAAPGSAAFDREPTDEERQGYLITALAQRSGIQQEVLDELSTAAASQTTIDYLRRTGRLPGDGNL